MIRRAAYARIKQAFEAHGVRFAYPTVTINSLPAGAAADEPAPARTEASATALLLRRNAAGSA